MSLEANIAELNTNIKALIAALAAGIPAVVTGTVVTGTVVTDTVAAAQAADTKPQADTKPAAEKAKATAGKKQETQSSGTTNESAASAAQSGTGESTGKAAPVYDDVKNRVLQIAKDHGRPKTEALLSRFGVKSAKELLEAQFAEFIELADKLLAGEYDPEAADAELA